MRVEIYEGGSHDLACIDAERIAPFGSVKSWAFSSTGAHCVASASTTVGILNDKANEPVGLSRVHLKFSI